MTRRSVRWMPTVSAQGLAGKNRTLNLASRGCTLGGNFQVFKDRRSVILEVWAAPGPRRPLQKVGGGRGPGPPRAQKWPISDPSRLSKFYSHPKCSHLCSRAQTGPHRPDTSFGTNIGPFTGQTGPQLAPEVRLGDRKHYDRELLDLRLGRVR